MAQEARTMNERARKKKEKAQQVSEMASAKILKGKKMSKRGEKLIAQAQIGLQSLERMWF